MRSTRLFIGVRFRQVLGTEARMNEISIKSQWLKSILYPHITQSKNNNYYPVS